MHTLLDLHGNIPTLLRVTSGAVHDVNILDEIMPEAGAFHVMDRAYIDFQRLFVFTLSSLSDHPKPATDYHLKTGQRE
jgi:hypothetical protein